MFHTSHLEWCLARGTSQQMVAQWWELGHVGVLHFSGVAVGKQEMTHLSLGQRGGD